MPEHLSLPMIVTVRGHPSSSNGRSAVATQLANHLKYTLIDQDDVAKTLQDSFPSSSSASQNLSNLSFKVLQQIASAQLGSNLGVVINSPLLNHTHLDQLKRLANSRGADLILIQCRPPDEIDDYDVVGVRKLTVDTTEPFDVKEFVSEHLGIPPSAAPQAVSLQTKMEKPNISKGKLVKTPSLRPPKKVTERIHRHLHALTLLNKPRNESSCKRCEESISGPCYQCPDCDEYIFDKSCAEFPGDLEIVRKECPDYLKAKEPKEYRFSEKQRYNCNICEQNRGFSRDCHDCLFQTNMKGKFLPIVVNHESHGHPLNLIIMPLSLNYEYGCCGCGEFGKSVSYRCYDCNYNLHAGCVLLPSTARSERHQHPLRLTYDALDHNYWEKSYCVVCKKETNPEQWFYSCPVCDIVAHIGCASA